MLMCYAEDKIDNTWSERIGFVFHYSANHVLEETTGTVIFADSSVFKYLILSMQFVNFKNITMQFINILITVCYCSDLCCGFVTLFAGSHVTDKGQVSLI